MTTSHTSRTPVHAPAAWRAADVADTVEWTIIFSDAEREEIVTATRRALDAGLRLETLRRADFPLPALETKAARWADELAEGRGFVLLRRFPTDRVSPDAAELAYLGLGLHLGNPVSQDAFGTLLGHVRDEGVTRDSPALRLYRTNARQDFHTDGADLVGLLCLERARHGGESRIASSYGVYNAMLERRPDLVDVLYQPFFWDRNDEQGEGEAPFYPLAPFVDINGTPRIFYIGWYIRDAQRHPDVPRLTEAQREAMAMLEAIANDPSFYVEMDFQPGDVQLLNNAKILHARESYEDHADPARRRHLLRLWLAAHQFSSVEDALQQGIPQSR